MPESPPTPSAAASPWRRRLARHFERHPRLAGGLSVVLGLGLLALAWAAWQLTAEPPERLLQIGLAIGLAALAAALPVRIGRTPWPLTAADALLFGTLAAFGPAAGVLAAGAAGLSGTLCARTRPQAGLPTPLLGMASMAAAGGVYLLTQALLRQADAGSAAGELLALCAAAALYGGTTALLRRLTLRLRGPAAATSAHRLRETAFTLPSMLASALVAGLVHLTAAPLGGSAVLASVAVVLAVIALLRVALRRLDAQRAAREARAAAARRDAEAHRQRFTVAFAHAAIGMAIVRPDGSLLQVNQALAVLFGRPEAALLGTPLHSLLHEADAGPLLARAEAVLQQHAAAFSMELRCRRGDGERWMTVHCSSCGSDAGGGACLIVQFVDVTERHEAEKRLQHIAYHDALTGLANRACFHERLQHAVERSRLDAGTRFAVLFLDVDRFKVVNDSRGHPAGDELLREVGQRLQTCVRPRDLVARLGGDEFAVLLEDLHEPGDAERLATGCCWCWRRRSTSTATARSGSAPASASRSATWATAPSTRCCATPTSRCTKPRPPAAAARASTTCRCTSAWPTGSSSRPTCAARWPKACCTCTSSRSTNSCRSAWSGSRR